MHIAAAIFILFTTVTIAFQLALAAGAPWGELAMGGKFPGTLPTPMRVAAVVQSVILAGLALIVASRAGLVDVARDAANIGIWVAVAFSAVASVMNVITPSRKERRLWAPVALAMLASSLVVALGSST